MKNSCFLWFIIIYTSMDPFKTTHLFFSHLVCHFLKQLLFHNASPLDTDTDLKNRALLKTLSKVEATLSFH